MRGLSYSRYSDNWTIIGFQGKDPATDLRGVGILGLLQIINIIDFEYHFVLDIIDNEISPPLCISLLNFTQICLRVLRTGKLN